MKKQYRSLVVLLVALVAMGVIWAAVTYIPGMSVATVTTTTTRAEVAQMFKTETSQVSKVTVNNAKGRYVLIPEEVKSADGKTLIAWRAEGFSQLPLSSSMLEEVANSSVNIVVNEEIGADVADLAPYGLAEPTASVVVDLKDGTSRQVDIGTELPSRYYDYAMLAGTRRVVTIPTGTGDRFRKGIVDFLDRAKILGFDESKLDGFMFERSRDNLKLDTTAKVVGTQENQYVEFQVITPIKWAGNTDNLNAVLKEALGLQPVEFVALSESADLNTYGLAAPAYRFTLRSPQKTVTISIGSKADDRNYYAMSSEVPAVLTIAQSALTKVDLKAIELFNTFVCLENISEVSSVEAKVEGIHFITELNLTGNQSAKDEGAQVFLDGVNARVNDAESGDSIYSGFYRSLISPVLVGLDPDAKPTGSRPNSLLFKVRANPEKGTPERTRFVEFSQRDAYTDYVFVDGTYVGGYIDRERVYTNKKKGDEGIVVAYKMLKHAIANQSNGLFDSSKGYPID